MDINNIKLDPEEQWIEDHIEEFVPVSAEERKRFEKAIAKDKKERMISLRMNGPNLYQLKQMARDEGLPYQTFISSILHKYITHQLIDIKEAKKMLRLTR